ncbi:MAG: hypothetical protein PHZ09_10070 [Eubacteriales bacterium]|nr:hypothetical protein [Eubacteriales bacterium]
MIKRPIALIILFAMFFAYACGGEAEVADPDNAVFVSAEAETAPEKLTDGLPDKNLDGWELSLLSHHDHLSNESTIYAEALGGEVINDAIYNRNTRLEERFNFTMTLTPGNGWATDYNMLKNSVRSGSRDFNMSFLLPYATSGNIVLDGYLYNMLAVEYLNFDQSWWHNNVNDMFTFHG